MTSGVGAVVGTTFLGLPLGGMILWFSVFVSALESSSPVQREAMWGQQHQQRLSEREAQTRGWTAPMPDFSAPRYTEATKMRVEWDTRDTMNNRHWTAVQVGGPKAVTSAMLTTHPTAGASPMMPATARQDNRTYGEAGGYFPDARPTDTHRPQLPTLSHAHNPWFDGFHTESPGAARELRGAVYEHRHTQPEDHSKRIMSRQFEHQWVPPTVTNAIVNAQIDASVALRPRADDYHMTFRP